MSDPGLLWSSEQIDELMAAVAAFDREKASPIVLQLADEVRGQGKSPDDGQQKAVFKALRSARWFALMQTVGESLVATHRASALTRRQYGQALVDQGTLDEALTVLQDLRADPSCPAEEKEEAGGLVGRVYKQLYVDQFALLGPARRPTLESSIRAYYDTYKQDRKKLTWQGVNAVAMILRGRRDKIPVDVGEAPEDLAQAIALAAAGSGLHWDLATEAEAYIALGQWDEATKRIEAYVKHPDLDAFSAASTLRQLKEVWQIRQDGIGGTLLTLLQPATLKGAPASGQGLQNVGAGLRLAPGELGTALSAASENRASLEKVFGTEGPRSFGWYKMGLDRAKAVARVESASGRPVGTGFLVKASSLFRSLRASDELVLVTNSHVLGEQDPDALRTDNAVVRWEAVETARRAHVREILFESPASALDVTVARLDTAITGIEPYTLAPAEEPVFRKDHRRELYVIGHPAGGELALSIDDNLQLGWGNPFLHYRTPTKPGSSGSPVFDEQWRLIAVHHKGSDTMPRRDGVAGTYQANEGIWIHAVLAAIAVKESTGAQLEVASPPVRPAFRNRVFVSYAHADTDWLEMLRKFLKPLERAGKVDIWSDQKIATGSNWSAEIERQLDAASVAILLVSQNFVASDFINQTELPKLLEANAKRGLTIIPIAVRPWTYGLVPELQAIQFANDPKKTLLELTEAQREVELASIAGRIADIVAMAPVANSFRAMDAVAFKETGLGGTTPAEAGLSSFGARTVQVEDQIVLKSGTGQAAVVVPVVSLNQMESLGVQERQLIEAINTDIQEKLDRWTELFPRRSARDSGQRDRVRTEMTDVRVELCKSFNWLIDFYVRLGAPLQDHYLAVRQICANGDSL